MNYFKNTNNEIFAYDDEQVQQGYGADLTAITKEEVDDINKAKEDEAKAQPAYKVSEAKQYLASTDWYYPRLTETGKEVPADVVAKRIEARELINNLEVTNG